jgi:hypothetical protein
MKIHGVRIYPQSVKVVRGAGGAPIYLHDSVTEDCSDFFYIFRPLTPLWRGHFFANDFAVSYDQHIGLEDPIAGLFERYGPSLVAADLESQSVLLRGDGFASWGAEMYFCEGAFLPIFRAVPTFDFLKQLHGSRDFPLTSATWPRELRAVLHMWDDVYWQLFTTERTDVDLLIRAHAGDPKLKMYSVDFDREFPEPSNEELPLAAPSDEP